MPSGSEKRLSSTAVECVTSKKRMPHVGEEERRQNHDEEKRGHALEEMRSRRKAK